jgi:2',3'-cyclic-nucleotide 2'-phosphodiesterase (5'-nucleotidase family)
LNADLITAQDITNITHVIPAAKMVTDKWFTDAISITDTIDLFLVLGHNTVLQQKTLGTFGYVYDAIRKLHPHTPIQFFGGHSHIRDFKVYDEASTALESGRYCETMGWLSMTGFNQTNSGYNGSTLNGSSPHPTPTRPATSNIDSVWSYARRYLDWNRLTFEFHASGSQTNPFDTAAGLSTTAEITSYREKLNLTKTYGCSPQNYCIFCAEFDSSSSVFPLISEALTTIVVNPNRTDKSRVSVISTGSVRSDLTKGPFTYDDVFIVSPYTDKFQYIRDVRYSLATGVLA